VHAVLVDFEEALDLGEYVQRVTCPVTDDPWAQRAEQREVHGQHPELSALVIDGSDLARPDALVEQGGVLGNG
jgi:hypothetical protein